MPSVATGYHSDTGKERQDIVLGDLYGKSCGQDFIQLVETHFQHSGLSVSRNKPYQGGYITQTYGNPSGQVHSLQIEINRKLYMNEKTQKIIPEKFEALKNVIENLIYKVREWQP